MKVIICVFLDGCKLVRLILEDNHSYLVPSCTDKYSSDRLATMADEYVSLVLNSMPEDDQRPQRRRLWRVSNKYKSCCSVDGS